MAYNTKRREEFLDYLKDVKINQLPEENLIKDFTPTGLSNLYELFVKLKDISMNDNQFNYLSKMISSNYDEKILSLLSNPITDCQINQLLEFIKQSYLQIVQHKNPENIPEDEISHLKTIVNQHYPTVFLDFIENPINAKEFSKQQNLIKEAVHNLAYEYYQQTTPHGQKNSNYLSSAIYLIYRKLYPEFSTSIPERKKGEKSFNDNMHKELNNSIINIVPTDIKTGITFSDMEKHIVSNPDNKKNFTDKTNSDISAITIVLNYVDDSIYFDESDPENEEILKLKKQKNDNLKFMHSVKRYLNENDIFMTQEEYFQIYIQLLQRLQDCTYPECTHEIKEGSYSSRLSLAIDKYKKNMQENSFSPNATDLEIEELYTLTECLKRRLDDKLQHEILKVTFPHVLEDTLLTDDFKITGKFIKDVKKANGFCALYFELIDANGRKTEVQLQSNMRYKETKNGPSTHNGMPNKKVDVNPFFELADGSDDPKRLEHYLFLLGRTSRIQEQSLRQKLKTLQNKFSCSEIPEEKRKLDLSIKRLEKKISSIETARNSIKIKDEFTEEYDMIDTENTKKEDNYELKTIGNKTFKLYNTKTTKRIAKTSIEKYLPLYAEYISPISMDVISSAHATAPEAHINKKTLVDGFTEMLRKGDEITYLSELLINKLKEILNIKDTNQISLEELSRYAKNEFYAEETDSSNNPSIEFEGTSQDSER